MSRGFWEYREPDGRVTNLRVKWFIGAVVVSASLGGVAAILGGMSTWWPVIIGGAVVGAAGTLIAFTIDYVHDKHSAGVGNE